MAPAKPSVPPQPCARVCLILGGLLFALLLLLPFPEAAAGEDAGVMPISAFFGHYAGRTLFPMGEAANRDLRVSIQPFNAHGMTVTWETSILKGDDGASRKSTSVNFEPTSRPGIFAAVFPQGGEPDLAAGESYPWARLAGRTLTVTVFTIVDGGDYLVQQYDRTLSDAGLLLEFRRLRNGVVERQIKGNLNRIDGPEGN